MGKDLGNGVEEVEIPSNYSSDPVRKVFRTPETRALDALYGLDGTNIMSPVHKLSNRPGVAIDNHQVLVSRAESRMDHVLYCSAWRKMGLPSPKVYRYGDHPDKERAFRAERFLDKPLTFLTKDALSMNHFVGYGRTFLSGQNNADEMRRGFRDLKDREFFKKVMAPDGRGILVPTVKFSPTYGKVDVPWWIHEETGVYGGRSPDDLLRQEAQDWQEGGNLSVADKRQLRFLLSRGISDFSNAYLIPEMGRGSLTKRVVDQLHTFFDGFEEGIHTSRSPGEIPIGEVLLTDYRIGDRDLPGRAYRSCRRGAIRTLGDLQNRPKEQLERLPGLGGKGFGLLKKTLDVYGGRGK